VDSLILRLATRYIAPLLAALSVILFFRGHNHPGGGFIGGLTISVAFILYCLAYGVQTALARLRVDPRLWMAAGLLLALTAGLAGSVSGKPFLSGLWVKVHLPLLGEQHLGTPMIFDLGVYLLVIGAVATIIANLAEERF
jgi:multicomponent Na+:H+ antiporter subunit B